MSTRLVSLALFDPDGVVAPFVRRTIEQLDRPGTTIVATATHPLAPADAEWIRERAELIERDNVGLDMGGHAVALAAHSPEGFDEVLLTNDTYALLAPLDRIEDRIDPGADFWGITGSNEVAPHVQSYFVDLRSPIPASEVFRRHWDNVRVGSRRRTIVSNEVGLSRKLRRAGFRFDVAYHPDLPDAVRAQLRGWRHGIVNPRAVFGQWNPNMALADAALDGRMPVVKMSALRYDPFKLGADKLLTRLEERYPAEMDGVRAYLDRTARAYR